MVDSINIVVENIENLSLEYLKENNIKYTYIRRKNIISITYNQHKLIYYKNFRNLELRTTVCKLIGREDKNIKDRELVISKMQQIINKVLNTNKIYELHVTRMDYKIDLKIEIEMARTYNKLLHKLPKKYKGKIRIDYDNSIYIKSKSGKTYNIYIRGDRIKYVYNKKSKQINNKYRNNILKLKEVMEQLKNSYKNDIKIYDEIYRIEVQTKKGSIKRISKKRDLKRTIEDFWTIENVIKECIDELEDYIHKGDYYKLDYAEDIIESSDYSKTIKKRLIEFIRIINEENMDSAKDYYSNNTRRKHIERLEALNLNPVTLKNDADYDMLISLITLLRIETNK